MKLLPQNQAEYFYSIVLVLLLFQEAVCVEDTNEKIKATQKSSLSSAVSTNSSTSTLINGSRINVTEHDEIKSITKQQLSSDGSPGDITTSKANLSHDNIPSNAGLPEHFPAAAVSASPHSTSNGTPASFVINSTSSIASNASSPTIESHSPSVFPTVQVHRKSKPEETTVDEIVRDSGPTTDYVVPLVVAMLAVPLVGVLCALLYMKGRDFWERRHYGRIDFLWDSRNDSRMDFLIDGMYNN